MLKNIYHLLRMKPDSDLCKVIVFGQNFNDPHVRYPWGFERLDKFPMNRFSVGVENHFLVKKIK